MSATFANRSGRHLPPGATPDAGGVNFSVFCRDATAVELRLYASAASEQPAQVIALLPDANRTFFFWHVYVEGLQPGALYTWRVARSGEPIDAAPELLDPWARAVSDARWDRRAGREGRYASNGLRGVVVPRLEKPGAAPRRLEDAVVYELHVGGFTQDRSSKVKKPGTFAGLVEKIPYLKELGITHVELLPVMAFDEQDVPESARALGLRNYWGYSTHCFYAPHPRYCADPGEAPKEFRDCVQAFHDAGIGVILDVVFNHTSEGGADGPVISFKGLAPDVFYHRDADGAYRDYSGCGNSVNCNHPLVTGFVVRCLEYWAGELGVDGFRFDLASIFARGEDGQVVPNPALPWSIELSPALARTALIAEAWDATGLYQVGRFPGMRWAEWNGRYRDVIRRFVRGEPGIVGEVATRIAGSSDLYGDHRMPDNSVNFVTCHDGFTLADLVSYDRKHNEANGEGNADGSNDNLSWNCGTEGETGDPTILGLRRRQAKNLMAILFLSQGVPMLNAGDELLRTQRGNNNAYSQDNEISWLDWSLVERSHDMLRFVKELIALRKRHASLRRRRFLRDSEVAWHGVRLGQPPWNDPGARLLAFTLRGTGADEAPLHVVLNMSDAAQTVELPELPGLSWRRAVDTALPAPHDIARPDEQATGGDRYLAQPRGVVVLEAR
jgi:glycogen operon protein